MFIVSGKAVPSKQSMIIRSPNKFSVTNKNKNNFSYLEALNTNGADKKKFSFDKKNLVNSLQSKLKVTNRDAIKFSYAEAMRRNVESGRKAAVNVNKLNIDVIKSKISQPIPVIKQDIVPGVSAVQTGSALNTTIKTPMTAKPVTATTTEQQETEAPESEQAVLESPVSTTAATDSEQVASQASKCFCMHKCRVNLSVEGFCGRPDQFGNRKFKCCSSTEPMSAEAGEAYEVE